MDLLQPDCMHEHFIMMGGAREVVMECLCFAAAFWTQLPRDWDESAIKEGYKVPLASCV